ncbi:MAG TPA: class I SAM-dependent rRNA methyltransferase [Gammaproteobacteria bacterium]|nr:class I SAM-dependent rRNA methyltransferase [Gammaproteobacteria bacterium]
MSSICAETELLRLRKGEDRRLRAGHLWVYSNEVDSAATPMSRFAPGELVRLEDARGQPLGLAYVNPHSLICARILTRRSAGRFDSAALARRLESALRLRESLYAAPYYRLAYGESDALPGLVVDRYGALLVVQITTAGMERLRAEIVAALVDLLAPEAIVLRNDVPARELEHLPSYVEVPLGTVPEVAIVEENATRFEVSLLGGQKTGWYFDHRANRERMRRYVAGRRVLDVFSYVGAWGVQALTAGAAAVTCIDASANALAQAERNAALNGVGDRLQIVAADAFDALKSLVRERERFDVVVLDPPAFVKRRKDLKEGAQAYRRLNALALQLLDSDGILISSSCSYHMSRDLLLGEIRQAGQRAGRGLQILEQGHQAPDHPVHPAMPETDYLKTFIVRVRSA